MSNVLKLKNSSWSIGGETLGYMLGMNVLEDEALAFEVAQEISKVMKRLERPFVFKASFDKANRSSIKSFRGPGLEKGLKILEKVKTELSLPIITDIHELDQAEAVAQVADIVQIPAFLCRQTDLLLAACKSVEKNGGLLHVKKGQFLAPWDCKNIADKVKEVIPDREILILCERGVSFGYNNLIVDLLGIQEMKKLAPVTIDATHAVQLPGAGRGEGGQSTATGGRREGVEILALGAVVAGADGVFLEFHPEPQKAKCDGPSCLALSDLERIIKKIEAVHSSIR
ncbi:MAG: 3-deoxy-8-phosphooctulonate synthase [Oligoflexia bacterium]|nr:3-deoxy-8-phosphooctulonate synthase [Oligoflexia bacterium]